LSPILGIWASAQQGTSLPNSYESISTVTVGAGGQATVTFSSIPSTYKHLQLRWIAQDNRGTFNDSNLAMRINSDTGSTYNWHYVRGNGSTTEAIGQANKTSFDAIPVAATAAGSSFSVSVADFLDYADTNKFKTMRLLSGQDFNGSGIAMLTSGAWRSTSAITSISIYSNLASSINQYSQFALYGIKG
jgi:hypothetical protein